MTTDYKNLQPPSIIDFKTIEEYKKAKDLYDNSFEVVYENMSFMDKNISKAILNHCKDTLSKIDNLKSENLENLPEINQVVFINELLNLKKREIWDPMRRAFNHYFYEDDPNYRKILNTSNHIKNKIQQSIESQREKDLQEYDITVNSKNKPGSGRNIKVINGRTKREEVDFLTTLKDNFEEIKYSDQISVYIGTDYRYAMSYDIDFKKAEQEAGGKIKNSTAWKLAEDSVNRAQSLLGINFIPTLTVFKFDNSHMHFWYIFDEPVHCKNWSHNCYTLTPEEETLYNANKNCFLFVGRVLSTIFEHADPHHTFGMGKNPLYIGGKKKKGFHYYDTITRDSEGTPINREEWVKGTYNPVINKFNFLDILRAVCLNIEKINTAYPEAKFEIPYDAYLLIPDLEIDIKTFRSYAHNYINDYVGNDIPNLSKISINSIKKSSHLFNHLNLKTYEGDDIKNHAFFNKLSEQVNKINNLLPIKQSDLLKRLIFEFKYPSISEKELIKGDCVRHNPSFINASRSMVGLFLDGIIDPYYEHGVELIVELMKFYQYFILPLSHIKCIETDDEIIPTARTIWKNVISYAMWKKNKNLQTYHFCQSYFSHMMEKKPAFKGGCGFSEQQRIYGVKRSKFNFIVKSLPDVYSSLRKRKIQNGSKNYKRRLKNQNNEDIRKDLDFLTKMVEEDLIFFFKNKTSPKILRKKMNDLLLKERLLKEIAKVTSIDISKLLNLLQIIRSLFKRKTEEEFSLLERVNYFVRRESVKDKIIENYDGANFGKMVDIKRKLLEQNLTIEDVNNFFEIKEKLVA